MSEDLKLTVEEGLATITLNRPTVMNAMTFAMWAEMLEMVQEIEHDPEVRCVLITGAGANFCAGQDIGDFARLAELAPRQLAVTVKRELDKTNPLFLALERIPQPVVVSVRGNVLGGGLSIVAVADLIVASENSKFSAAQIKLGAIPDTSLSFNLRRAIGIKKAKQYCLLGESIDAPTAAELGLINWVVPDNKVEEKTVSVLRSLLSMAPIALARTKAALNNSFRNTLASHAAEESLDVGLCVMAPEFLNNVRAFTGRRNSSK
jgi:2-(1,2-epoxy-1,2-dihydrophenyl)acetyl-CoA isomerase